MTYARVWLVLVTAVATVACSSSRSIVKPDGLDSREQQAVSSRTALVLRRPLPSFQIYTTTDQYLQLATAPFGLAAIWGTFAGITVAADHRSEPFIRDNQLVDPALGVASELGRYFGPRLGIVFAGLTGDIIEAGDPHEISEPLRGRADLALDLQTVYWGLTTSMLRPEYRFGYRGSMRVIEVQSGAILASGQCSYWPDSSHAAKLDDLTDSQANLLKAKIRSAVESCASQFTDIILNRPDPKTGVPK